MRDVYRALRSLRETRLKSAGVLPVDRLLGRICRAFHGDALGHRSADDLPTPRVDNGRQVELTLGGANVGDVAHSEAVVRARLEHAVDGVEARIALLDRPHLAAMWPC